MSPTESTPAAAPVAGSRWRLRFFAIFVGQALSLIGSALTQFVLLWWITDTTGSAAALALAGAMALLPQAVLGPLGGAVADRWNRRVIMILADGITALCMVVLVGLFASGSVQLWHVYTLMFVRSCMQAFQQPAAAASTAMLTPSHWLSRVAGLNQAVLGVMTIAAAPLGALALAYLPLQSALLIDVFTALAGIAPLFVFSIPQPAAPTAHPLAVWDDLRAGVRYVAARRGLVALYAVNGLVVLTVMPTFSLTPLLVREWFGGGVNEVAFMEAWAGVGIIGGGLLMGVWAGQRRRVALALVSFAASCLTVALTALAPGDRLGLATFWWFLSGVTFSTGNAPLTAVLQTVVPNHLQGRVLSLLASVVGLAGPLGLAIAGPLGEALGVRAVFVLGGLLSTAVCLGALFLPDLLKLDDAPPAEAAR